MRINEESRVADMTDVNSSVCLAPTTGFAPQTFAAALQFFTAAQCLLHDNTPPDNTVLDGAKYDYIIVGGGTAGCVLAARLSEDAQIKVLLIEYGPYPAVESTIPGMDKGLFGSKYDYQYYYENDGVTAQGIVNGEVYCPRGKMLGGCSNINAMIYGRGNPYDYQRWYNAGNKDWDPITVKRYFEKAESLQDQSLLNNLLIGNYYGHDGPMAINTFNSTYRPITLRVLESYDEIGMKTVKDLNFANNMGSGIMRATAANGVRFSTDHAYLNTIRSRTNLDVITDTLATKVIINGTTKVAQGVEVERNGTKMIFYANLEVIISAGAINTPQLLMLSGVGPKEHLESLNITCIVDSPAVGQYLQDHLKVPVTIYGKQPGPLNQAEQHLDAIKYIYDKKGYLAQSSIADILAFSSRSLLAVYPEFQTHLIIHWMNSTSAGRGFTSNFKFKPGIVQSVVEQNKDNALYVFLATLLHPKSYGNITLRSSNPRDYPRIFSNYFKDESDLDATVEGIKKLTKIVQTKYFKEIQCFLGRMDLPACNGFELGSNEYWRCICKNTVTTIYHPVGTARMGSDIKTSVVSSKLKVHLIGKLRVIDASVMPSHVSGNTNGPVIMIAERGADLVKSDHGTS